MQYITTTQLRTKSTDLISLLAAGASVDLIHRSKIVGTIQPKSHEPKALTPKDIIDLKKAIKALNLPKLSDKQREANYRRHLLKKYGPRISGH